MTISINENPILATSLAAKSPLEFAGNQAGAQQDGIFADKLASILSGSTQNTQTEQAKAQSIAEVLHLQMLHTTLTLSGEAPTDTPSASHLFDRQTATLQALVNAYSANSPENGSQAEPTGAELTPVQESTEPDSATPAQTLQSTKGSQWLDPVIAKASRRYGVDMGLIKAVIKAESNFNPTAVSSAGARGLMQLMPATARALGVNDSFDPEQNVMAGTRFLRDLLDRYNGDLDSALAAYNWGPGNVDKRPGRLPHETRNYLSLVKQLYNSYTV